MIKSGIIIYILTIAILASLTIICIPKAFTGKIIYIIYTIFFLGLTLITGMMFRKYKQLINDKEEMGDINSYFD